MRLNGCLCSISVFFALRVDSILYVSVENISLDVAHQAVLYIKLVLLSCETIIPFAFLRPLISPDHCVCKLVLTLDFKFSQVDMVISLDDVDIIVMPRMNIGELTETCRLSA